MYLNLFDNIWDVGKKQLWVLFCALFNNFTRWLALPSQKDYQSLGLSNSACEMLHVLKNHLHQMELQLSRSLFNLFWQSLAADLNNFLYKQVRVLKCVLYSVMLSGGLGIFKVISVNARPYEALNRSQFCIKHTWVQLGNRFRAKYTAY